MQDKKQIKIISCRDSLLWYSSHVGEVFDVVRIESNSKEYYWTREKDPPHYLNWVAKQDAVLIEDKEPEAASVNQTKENL